MSVHERPEEATAYLLGELDAERAAAFEHAMAGDAALRAEVERLRPVVSRLERMPSEAWEDEEPPPLRLPDELALREPESASLPPRRSRLGWLRGPLVMRPALAAALAALLLAGGVGIGALLDGDGNGGGPTGPALALDPVGNRDPTAQGRVLVADGSDVTLRVDGLEPTGSDAFYELWLLGEDGRLVALGSFRVDRAGTARLRLPLPVDPGAFRYFDISREPADGDAGHSGESVLRGPTRI